MMNDKHQPANKEVQLRAGIANKERHAHNTPHTHAKTPLAGQSQKQQTTKSKAMLLGSRKNYWHAKAIEGSQSEARWMQVPSTVLLRKM